MRNHRILYAAVLIAALLMGCAPQEDAAPTDQPAQAASGQPRAEFPLDENGCPDPGVIRVNGLLYPVGLTEHESAPQETVDIRLERGTQKLEIQLPQYAGILKWEVSEQSGMELTDSRSVRPDEQQTELPEGSGGLLYEFDFDMTALDAAGEVVLRLVNVDAEGAQDACYTLTIAFASAA